MSTIAPGTSTRGPAARRRAFRSADLGVGLLVVVATAGASWWLLGLPATHVAVSIALYLPLAAVVLAKLPADDPGPGIGPANRVTLGRCALAIPVAAMLFGTETGDTVRWWIVGVSIVALLLDGVDGAVARHTDAQTRFGARFDMEVDAALILVLSVLVWRLDRAGPWVVLIGAMRYLFVAAALVWPQLGAELPESWRRKVVCVVQGVVLLVALGPIVPARTALFGLVAGLAALTFSFAVDVRWAFVHAPRPRDASAG